MKRVVRPWPAYATSRALARRSFLAGLGSTAAACASHRLISVRYPAAPQCDPSRCTMVDIHCHVFNASDLNVKGFVSHVLPLPPRWTEWATGALHDALDTLAPSADDELAALANVTAAPAPPLRPLPAALQNVAAQLAQRLPHSLARSGEDVADTLQLIVRPRHEIVASLSRNYPQIDLFTPALVDYAYWSADMPESPLHAQLAVMARLSQLSRDDGLGRPGVRVHPFAPFNPLREVRELIETDEGPYQPLGAWKEGTPYVCTAAVPAAPPTRGALPPLRYAIEHGFAGAKVYPPTGFLPIGNAAWIHHQETGLGEDLDRALRAFYAYCEAEEVPVTTHANNSNGYALGYGTLTDPDHWENVLREFPRLRLNLGHFGDLEGDDGQHGIAMCALWMRKIASMMERYPNVYADSGCSSVPIYQDVQDRYVALLREVFAAYPRAKLRFMYGSDYWLNKLFGKSATFVDAFSQVFGEHFPEQRTAFFGDNALRFLGLIDDAGKPLATNRNRLRLHKVYAGHRLPAWLR